MSIKDIIFNSFSKAGSNVSRTIHFIPTLNDIFKRSIKFIPILADYGTRIIKFVPTLNSLARSIKFTPILNITDIIIPDIRTIIFIPILNTLNRSIKFIPVLSNKLYTLQITVLEEDVESYTVNFNIYDYDDCSNEFIELNC